MPCVFPRPDANEVRLSIDTAGQRHAFCSEACQHIFRQAPERHSGMTWWEVNDGVELSRYIEDGGLLRSDGRTLMGQPHVHTDERWLWTIDDIRRTGVVIQDPLKALPAEAFTEI
jgi:methane monooxygenase component A alpha chain